MQIHYLPGRVCSTQAIREIVKTLQPPIEGEENQEYTLISLKPEIRWVYRGEERLLQVAEACGAAMLYADRFTQEGEAPVIDYQEGALRDDFEFGALTLWRTDCLKKAVEEMDAEGVNYEYAGYYDLRLRVSRMGALEHVPEYLYYEVEEDTRKSGEKLFDYVNPANRQVQIEMEKACTAHLRRIGALISAEDLHLGSDPRAIPGGAHFGWSDPQCSSSECSFPVTASVVIPCKNRARTVGDAIESAAKQVVREGYSYNVFVVDDNSTDGTVEIIRAMQQKYPHVIYIAQDKTYHAIGGNWNMAIHDPRCGRYAIQLDSDDTYSDENTVQKFIDAFEDGASSYSLEDASLQFREIGAVVGTYQIITKNAEGGWDKGMVIDHREWTDENGMNNALRINGLGAPRAFRTDLLRQIDFPTTKYGEDYAVMLRISREYRIGRIYDVLYYCRRWEGNSDANCDIPTMNRNNWYKDRIRTWEVKARLKG